MRKLEIVAAASVAVAVFMSPPARAHFNLMAPANWALQSSLGDPQKSVPCGQADPGLTAMPTNVVTPFSPGETITVTINETIFHPGHYRVVLSTTGQSGLPPDPPVTPVGSDPCGSTVIQNPPVFPVLADGLLAHTSSLSGVQSFQVTLPSDVTCTNCTLQIAQYMSNHGLNNPGGCFYHHCANISIQEGGGTGGTAGGTGGGGGGGASGVGDGGPAGGNDDGSGCGCSTGRPGPSPIAVACLLALLVVAVRRRRS